ncbi:AraC family transcriptional regulator [Bacteroidia bacterium]|nr:AraC family transcriptional regulator [Bacteroidia bacterium]GHT26719.1 AraC family transcriptional regulator [Bacteroidia bacterium]
MNSKHAVIYQVTPLTDKDCFYIEDKRKKPLNSPIHTHKEYELNFVSQASGAKRIVGDSIETIGDYDLVLITGKNLEHAWEQGHCTSNQIREITIQFSPELFCSNFLKINPFESIQKMLREAQKGLSFPMQAIMKIYPLLDSLSSEKQDFYSVVKFLTLLQELSKFSDEAKPLSSLSFAGVDAQADSRRVQRVLKYINDHYKNEIQLNQLADLAGMTPVAFSRFFKIRTGKNPFDYIIDTRLGYATRLLVDSTMSICEICYESGFNNISYFNRIFKKKKKCPPKEFRENFHKK